MHLNEVAHWHTRLRRVRTIDRWQASPPCPKAITKFEKGEVKTKGGIIWTAKNGSDSEEKIEAGETCRIDSIEGNTLIVSKKEEI